MGIVHHANYLRYFEDGRVEWMRNRGIDYSTLAAKGVHLAVVESSVRHHRPARFDDNLTIETRLDELHNLSMRFAYKILRASTGEELASGITLHACVDDNMRLQKLPKDLILTLKSAQANTAEQ
jgi:acyl-CoA thioester hydrolase